MNVPAVAHAVEGCLHPCIHEPLRLDKRNNNTCWAFFIVLWVHINKFALIADYFPKTEPCIFYASKIIIVFYDKHFQQKHI